MQRKYCDRVRLGLGEELGQGRDKSNDLRRYRPILTRYRSTLWFE